MVNIEKMNEKEDFLQCSSCLKSSEEINIYKIEIGKSIHQTSTLKLCYSCLMNLRSQINKINF